MTTTVKVKNIAEAVGDCSQLVVGQEVEYDFPNEVGGEEIGALGAQIQSAYTHKTFDVRGTRVKRTR
jgi:hypothetical protein